MDLLDKNFMGDMSYDEYQKYKAATVKDVKIISVNEVVEKIKRGEKDFSNVRIVAVDWNGRDLTGFDFSGSKIEFSLFSGCKMRGCNFSNALIDWSFFSLTDLSNSNFKKSLVWNSLFDRAIIDNADFSESDIRMSGFMETNMSSANFSNSRQIRVLTSWTELTDADWDAGMKVLAMMNLAWSTVLKFKSLGKAVYSKRDKILSFYDAARKTIQSSGNANYFLGAAAQDSAYSDKAAYSEHMTKYDKMEKYGQSIGKKGLDKKIFYKK